MIIDLIEYIKEHRSKVQVTCCIVGAVLLVWSFTAVDTSHAHTWAEKYIPGFWSLFGFISCIVLIFFTKWFGNSGVQTREDYYDK